MPAERVSMRRVREILRLKYEGDASERAIARSLGIARSTVALTLERAAAAKLFWPLPATLTDRVLEAMLYAGTGTLQGRRRQAEPDWTHVHRELRRPGVTLMLLWEEYRAPSPVAIATAAGASCTGPGRVACRRRCDRAIPPASACLSTMPARRSS
jgi:predicted mannosyl-3-phosphoglycerate phosphatase (HAD superfamily)